MYSCSPCETSSTELSCTELAIVLAVLAEVDVAPFGGGDVAPFGEDVAPFGGGDVAGEWRRACGRASTPSKAPSRALSTALHGASCTPSTHPEHNAQCTMHAPPLHSSNGHDPNSSRDQGVYMSIGQAVPN